MCFESCLKGRAGICCLGCSTRLGIHLVALLTLAEVGIISWLFKHELGDGIFNLKVFAWLAIVVARALAYFSMCCDSISRRKLFFYVLLATTMLEVVMFTVLNIGLFDGTSQEMAFRVIAAWGLGSGLQIALIEVLSLVHLCMFAYFCAISFEYYTFARDDPAMIDREHAAAAASEKKAAAERRRAELARKKQQEESKQEDIEQQEPLLDGQSSKFQPSVNNPKASTINSSLGL